MKHYTTTFPEYINEVSKIIGRARWDSCSYIREAKPNARIGSDEMEIESGVIGAKGELIASHFLFTKGIDHELNTLLDDKPVCDYDIMINGKKVDVKTVPHYGKFLLVDVDAHFKKVMDYYLFVKAMENNTAEIWLISYSTVNSWKRKQFGNRSSICAEINDINKQIQDERQRSNVL